MKVGNSNSYGTHSRDLSVNGKTYSYHSLKALEKKIGRSLDKMPRSHRVLLENLLRNDDGDIVRKSDIDSLLNWNPKQTSTEEIQFTPARVLLQDFTGVPVVADLAAMRTALDRKGGNAVKVNPLQPVDLVIDHSVQVDFFGTQKAFQENADLDFTRNGERYEFLKWGQKAFSNFQVVPPNTGICHQVNLEYLAHVAMAGEVASDSANGSDGQSGVENWVIMDTLVGTDSHTPMVNGLGVIGWGVGGIEAEAAMLGQPCSMLIPDVVGFELTGQLKPGVTATDLVLTITQILRKKGVVGKFVEFTGVGIHNLSIANRATISNMAPEYGATVGYWPVDQKTIDYLELTGRSDRARLAKDYYTKQGMFTDESSHTVVPDYTDLLTLDLSTVEPSLAGPAKPHDRHNLTGVVTSFKNFLAEQVTARGPSKPAGAGHELRDGSIVIAAITSCTNTSNPALMLGAAVLARNAVALGLKVPSFVKTSFAPGSKAASEFIEGAGLMPSLNALGFNLVGYGCTTCIGNSGPLPTKIAEEVESRGLTVAAALSGNRNFEARIHPLVRANYLCSPPLVVAFALAGRIDIDLSSEPIGNGKDGKPVFLKDIWPDDNEIQKLLTQNVTKANFEKSYSTVFEGDDAWRSMKTAGGAAYSWSEDSTYIKRPPFLDDEFVNTSGQRPKIENARVLGYFGDFITTDHISPAGSIGAKTPAGQHLNSLGVKNEDFNSYGARRGNHEVMMRGTFANVRLRNKLVAKEGGFTKLWPLGQETTIYDAAIAYRKENTSLVIIAGREYGSGSSRDWAAKGTRLLGVKAVIAESFERIHRSNLVGMGVLPLEFMNGQSATSLGLKGDETFKIEGIEKMTPKSVVKITATPSMGLGVSFEARVRIDTPNELRYYDAGGILPYVLKRLT
jgi:aconitate hydratase